MDSLPSTKKNNNSAWSVLIIDDDEDDFIIARDMLRDAKGRKFDVSWANTFERGREELAANTYHAVLVDYDLGAHSGIELIREASERGYPGPLILFTGRGNYEVDVEAMEAGATLYLTKGEVNPRLLERAIRYAIELKQKEQALKKAEERFAKAFHSSPAALAITRAADGRYIEANESLCVMTGYRRDEIIGRTALELGLYADPAQRAELVHMLKEQRTVRNYEVLVQTKTGTIRTLLGSFDLVELDSEACLLATLIDITERKRVEEALRSSEDKYQAIFHAAPFSLILARLEDGVILDVNKGWEDLFGVSREEALGKTTLELGTIPEPEYRTRGYQELREHGRLRDFEMPYHTRAGKSFISRQSAEVVEISGTRYLLAVTEDITARKQAEQALRLSEERYRVAVINAPAVYSQTDRELRYQWIYNPHPDFRPEDVIGKRDDEFEESEDVRRLVARKQQVLDSGVGLREEMVFHRSDGMHTYDMTIEPLRDPNGQVIGVTTAAFDISNLKRAEHAVRESEERFRQLADAMPQLVWTARSDGTVDYYNQRYQEYEGIAPVDGTEWEWGPVLHPDDAQATIAAWNHSVQTGQIYQAEHRVRMADGGFYWHLSRGIPVRDSRGEVIRWFGTATNIHAQKESEEKLKRSNQELEQFAFVASHDLKEPLRKIILFGERLKNQAKGGLDEQSLEYLGRMQNAAERMQVMINGLLELSQVNRQGGNFTRIHLKELVGEIISDLEPRIQAVGGSVRTGDLPTIEADSLQMRQLFQNLIGNAIKFHRQDEPPLVRVTGTTGAAKKATLVEIRVEDNGIGFEQQEAERIFQPFQRLHGRSEYEGTGLGLAICQKIVERHHGTIEVQSAPQQGTTFIIRLPVMQTKSKL